MNHPLDAFSDPVRIWFQQTFGEPTPPQSQGWVPIQRGDHTLILAPTGSGKTLAAFLWAIDQLYRDPSSPPLDKGKQGGVRVLYVSPLKALNNDIERNLRVPVEGIRAVAERRGEELAELRVVVRTGDTPTSARTAMWKKPPHILITTPESLYLMLTSPRAREMFRTVRTVIVDEIHTLCGNKRGVHLSLSLERLEHLADERVQRIGLSATIKPLDEVARFLGGQAPLSGETGEGAGVGVNRPVTIVNATYRKPLDLRVITTVPDFRSLPGDTIWPTVIPHVLNDIRQHHSTLVFANNRRLAERTADRLNAQFSAEQSEEIPPGELALAPGGIPRDRGIFAIGAEGPIRAHHGSISQEARREMEENLKAGHLPALVGTSSLELGIDIGAVDLVVQLQSPKSVAQGLQRVGRSGHIVGETSVGHIYATFREDLLEAAAIARGMLEGDVEPTYTPRNALDVLAQQIVAMVAVEDWSALALYDLVRRAYAYRELTRYSFESVLAMLSGKYPRVRARIGWDRVNDRLTALPGSRLVAMMNPGTISDTGAFNVYLGDGKTKVGELDEEFIFETRVGDNFLLGSKVWRVLEIQDDRIVVGDAAGAVPRMPFWNGDYPWRPYELGKRIGKFRREIAEKIQGNKGNEREITELLQTDYALDENSARNLVAHVQQQLDAIGTLSSDQSIIVESFADAVGEPRLVIQSPFGGRVNGAWALALTSAIRERLGIQPEVQSNDDGILFRFPQADVEPIVEIVRRMSAREARERLVRELQDSALFGARFRMNAERALLLPKSVGRKRTPFWLKRLKAKDLLAIVSRYADFPIVAETYRDCLDDVLDLPHLEQVLDEIGRGEIRVTPIETAVPSPVAAGLLHQFIEVYMYQWDAPKAEKQLQSLTLRRELLDDLLKGVEMGDLLKPEALAEIETRVQHRATGEQARTAEELMLVLQDLGDLAADEIIARSAGDARGWLAQLAAQNRIVEIEIPTRQGVDKRWVPVEWVEEYRTLTSPPSPNLLPPPLPGEGEGGKGDGREVILRRFLRASGPVTRDDILNRYAFDESWLDAALEQLVASREILRGQFTPTSEPPNHRTTEFVDRHNLEQIHQRTLTLLRHEVQPVAIPAYADFLARWQHLSSRLTGDDALSNVMAQLRGIALPEVVWERDVLPARLNDYAPGDLDALCASGELVWVAQGNRVRLFLRGEGALFLAAPDDSELSANARAVYDYLKAEGASFADELARAVGKTSMNDAIGELATRGLVTNDSLDALRAIVGAQHPASLKTPLQDELSARLQSPRTLTRGRYYDAKRRVAQRMRAETKPAPAQGRWSLVHRAGVLGPALNDEERAEKLARVLLARYGVLTRDCLEREDIPSDWGSLYLQLQRMEMRGEVRRGYFVTGLAGVQFALPEAVEQLRQPGQETVLVLNATDPANIYGGEVPEISVRFAHVPSTHVVLQRGMPVLIAEDNGERITTTPDADARQALDAYLHRPNAPRHILISQWNGAAVLGSPAEELLHGFGFHRAPKGMER